MRKYGFLMIILVAVTVCFLVINAPGQKRDDAVTLMVSSAQSLHDAVTELVEIYKTIDPSLSVVVNFGGSGSLQRQIEQGAPVDLFISASVENMESLNRQGLLFEDSYKALLVNRMVLVASKDSQGIKGFDSLVTEDVQKVALGDPKSVPAGKYAKEILTFLGLYEKVEDKAVFAKDVKEVVTWVTTQNADAGMVYMTDALSAKELKIVAEAPEGSCTPIVYPVGIIKNSRYLKETRQFQEFLLSEAGMRVFSEYGFMPANGE